MFKLYVKRILKSPLFIACTSATVFFWISGCYSYMTWAKDEIINILYLYYASFTYGVVLLMVPVLMTIPFLFFFVEELQKKLVYYQMIRTSFRKYYRSQIYSALFSSFLSAAISVLVFSVICLIAGAGSEAGPFCTIFDGTSMEEIFYSKMWFLYVWYCVIFMLFSMPWTMFGLIFSLFTKNRYVLIAAPFVCYWAFSYIIESICPFCPVASWLWAPRTMLEAGVIYEDYWTMAYSILYPPIYHFSLSAILASIYFFVSKWRFRHEGI